MTNILNKEDGCIDELKRLFHAYKRTKDIEFKPGHNKYQNFQNNMKKISDNESKYMIHNSTQESINHLIIDPLLQQTEPIILDSDSVQPNSNDHVTAKSHVDVTIEEFQDNLQNESNAEDRFSISDETNKLPIEAAIESTIDEHL